MSVLLDLPPEKFPFFVNKIYSKWSGIKLKEIVS